MDLAEDVLAVAYEARAAIGDMRRHFTHASEGVEAKQEVGGDSEGPVEHAYVLHERVLRHKETFARLQALRFRFQAQFGMEAGEPLAELVRIVNELRINAMLLPEFQKSGNGDTGDGYWKAMQVLFEGGEDDPVRPRIAEAVKRIEELATSAPVEVTSPRQVARSRGS